MKKKQTNPSVSLDHTTTKALDKIVTLINRAEIGFRNWVYSIEVCDECSRKELIVHIRNYVCKFDYLTLQYVSGDMFKLECNGVAMLLTGNEVLTYMKNLDLVKSI